MNKIAVVNSMAIFIEKAIDTARSYSWREFFFTEQEPIKKFLKFILKQTDQGPVTRKSRELFEPEKPVVKLQSACFEKLIF